ncbi:MAG: cation diffusion facilitator family transporter [Alistipes sp.]|nr:cation diffusion facilitator family transporter [Alistipes sp.]MDE7128941.1 cation diffusion facilitator family transporter [Alistipes sp.]
MAHHNHTHEHIGNVGRALITGIAINVVYAATEFCVGIWQGSMGLIADAGHNMSDVAGLLLALIAVKLSAKQASRQYTFGYRKASILISLVNAVILLAAVVGIVWESIERFLHPSPVMGWSVAITAAIGVAVNFAAAWLLMRDKERDLNIRGAYLHMMLDALVSIGVVVSGITISLTGWNIIDPIIGLIVAAVIVYSSWHLLTESLRLAMDGVPSGIDMRRVEAALGSIDGVKDVHHIHVWAISTTQNALTAHLLVNDICRAEQISARAKELLRSLGIDHSTLEIETSHHAECHCR